MSIALIGAGAMGGAIGARLVATGSTLTVFDPNPEKVDALVQLGAKPAPSAAEAARRARAVILSLNAPRIVQAAVFGPGGVAEGAPRGMLVIDMSSIDPEATKALAAEAAEKGLRWVDSPLSGGIPKATMGELTLMQGGAAADVAEATALAEAAGVDAQMIPKALQGGRADSAILQEYMPRMAARDYRRTGRIDNMVKDLNGAADLARLTHTAMPLTALCAEVHRMLTAAGLGGEDQAALMEFFAVRTDRDARKDLS